MSQIYRPLLERNYFAHNHQKRHNFSQGIAFLQLRPNARANKSSRLLFQRTMRTYVAPSKCYYTHETRGNDTKMHLNNIRVFSLFLAATLVTSANKYWNTSSF